MKTGLSAILLFTVIGLGLSSAVLARDEYSQAAGKKEEAGLSLSKGVTALLRKEMIAIQGGVTELVPAIASGNWHKIAEIGKKIEASYIMKQQLTREQAEELHRKLPESFRELDREFHQHAGMLVKASEHRNAELANFYFFKLNEGCIKCHSKYAKHRFSNFAGEAKSQHNH